MKNTHHHSSRYKKLRRNVVKSFNPSDFISHNVQEAQIKEFTPVHTFEDFNFTQMLKYNILYKQYSSPTPIQDQVIPHVLEGRDVIGIANTGTGKTAAFLIPLIDTVLKAPHKKVLVMAPTRELAVQIKDEFRDFSDNLNLYAVLCIGGMPLYRQQKLLRKPFNFVIGTPGRIKDLVDSNSLNLAQFEIVVLDEADHMVDIGFIHDMKFIISRLSQKRQSLFFSATIDKKVEEIIAQFVTNPVTISVKKAETTSNIEQDVIKVTNKHAKVDQLHDLLIQKNYDKVLIFGRTKWGVQKLSDELVKRGFKADAIHGNKRQSQRLRTLGDFRQNKIQILIATDVASRGLDIDDVTHVINYDMPATREDYIHRIGRTGRAHKKGTAITFVD